MIREKYLVEVKVLENFTKGLSVANIFHSDPVLKRRHLTVSALLTLFKKVIH